MTHFFERRPEALLAAVTVLWGSTFIVTKGLVREIPVLPYVALRFSIAAMLLAAIFPRALLSSRKTLRDGAVLGGLQAAGLLFQVCGQVYTTASKSAFVTALSTAMTPLLCLFLYREIPRRTQAVGAVLATVGLGLLTFPGLDALWNRGDLYSLGSAFVYALVIVETTRYAQRNDVAALATLQTIMAAMVYLTLLVLARVLLAVLPLSSLPELLAREAQPTHFEAGLALRILYMAVFCTVLTFLAQTWAMRRMSATHAAVVFALEPLFATGLAIAVEGEAEWPGTRGAVGAVMIFAGIVASELRVSRQKSARQTPAAQKPD